jgi:hypothetical protein
MNRVWIATFVAFAAFSQEPEGKVTGEGAVMTIDHRDSATFLATAFLLDRVESVLWTAAGEIIVDSPYASGSYARADNFARQFGIVVTMTDRDLKPRYDLKRVRTAVYESPWAASVLERFRTPHEEGRGKELALFDSVVSDSSSPGLLDYARAGRTLILLDRAAPEGSRASPLAFGLAPDEPARFSEEACGKGRLLRIAPAEGGIKLLLNAVYLASAHVL